MDQPTGPRFPSPTVSRWMSASRSTCRMRWPTAAACSWWFAHA